MGGYEGAHQAILEQVDVLEFIDEDVGEEGADFGGLGAVGTFDQEGGFEDEVVEVEGVGSAEAFGVGVEDLGGDTFEGVGGRRKVFGSEAVLFV
jgi:hypothetical protein